MIFICALAALHETGAGRLKECLRTGASDGCPNTKTCAVVGPTTSTDHDHENQPENNHHSHLLPSGCRSPQSPCPRKHYARSENVEGRLMALLKVQQST